MVRGRIGLLRRRLSATLSAARDLPSAIPPRGPLSIGRSSRRAAQLLFSFAESMLGVGIGRNALLDQLCHTWLRQSPTVRWTSRGMMSMRCRRYPALIVHHVVDLTRTCVMNARPRPSAAPFQGLVDPGMRDSLASCRRASAACRPCGPTEDAHQSSSGTGRTWSGPPGFALRPERPALVVDAPALCRSVPTRRGRPRPAPCALSPRRRASRRTWPRSSSCIACNWVRLPQRRRHREIPSRAVGEPLRSAE